MFLDGEIQFSMNYSTHLSIQSNSIKISIKVFCGTWQTDLNIYPEALRRKLSTEELMFLNCDVGEDSWESFGLQGDPASPS